MSSNYKSLSQIKKLKKSYWLALMDAFVIDLVKKLWKESDLKQLRQKDRNIYKFSSGPQEPIIKFP